MRMVPNETWHKCYNAGWKGIIVDAAFQHPAKFSRALIRRIYAHAFERGWLRAGDHILDPFGGVALGALEAMRRGLHWHGVELEPRFVTLGNENIDLWFDRYEDKFPRWGNANLKQGDSRELLQVLGIAGAGVVSSPPFVSSLGSDDPDKRGGLFRDPKRRNDVSLTGEYGNAPGQLGAMKPGDFEGVISSPPYGGKTQEGNTQERDRRRLEESNPELLQRLGTCFQGGRYYGSTPGQLGAMKAAVSSPPWGDNLSRDVVDAEARRQWAREHGISNSEHVTPVDMGRVGCRDQEYGDPPGQLGTMGGAASSPPYQTGGRHQHQMDAHNTNGRGQTGRQLGGYADESPGQIQGSDNHFWGAARQVVAQTYAALTPGAVAIWVTKDFVRKKKRVPFSQQWAALCESVGFTLIEWNHAMLVEDNGTQLGMFGEDLELRKERKSFFRRLAEKKGSPRIDWEDILCMRKE